MAEANFTLFNEVKAKLPSLAFADIKDAALGKDYELSLIIVDKEKIRTLNREYRGKDVPTDILSFPLSETEGEIYINPEMSLEESKKFDRSYDNFIAFLFIHGLVHLKGYDHGSTMENIEAELRTRFGV
jgi:probable rRNA maturation factor